MKLHSLRLAAMSAVVVLSVLAVPAHRIYKVEAQCTTKCAPPPPPPPTVGEFGGPLAGLTTTQTGFFTGGYAQFAIKWDPIRGLGPVSTRTGCFTCHGRSGQGGAYNGPAPILAHTALPFDGFKGQVRNPVNDMPAFSDAVLSDQDIADIYTFVETLPGPRSAKDIPLLNTN